MVDPASAIAIIPAFNEAATIVDITRRAMPHVARVIVIDDGSTDGTPDALVGLPVEVLRNPLNRGKSASLVRGFARAIALGAELVVTLDGDGQHLPEDIPRLLAAAARCPGEIIIGARLRHRERMPRLRRFGNAMADFWISWAAGYPIRDSQSGMRLYPLTALACACAARSGESRFVLESEVLIDAARKGCRATRIEIDTIYGSASRDSHFRALGDTVPIVCMVARKLLQRGLNPAGLLRSLRMLPVSRAAPAECGLAAGPDLDR